MIDDTGRTEAGCVERERTEPLSQPDPIGSWLDVLGSLLRVSPGEKRAIRDELDSHLRDRVRDIMLTGMDEVRATRDAIGELGEAAELAARYGRAARTPSRRRLAMNIGMLGVAGAALLTSVMALNDAEQPAGLSVYPGGTAREESGAVPVAAIRAEGDALSEVLQRVASGAGLRLVVDWESLAPLGFESVSEVRVDVPNGSIDAVLGAISDGTTRAGSPDEWSHTGGIDYRVADGVLRVASGHAFDLSERVLATIDVAAVLESGAVSEEQITGLVTEFIEPEQWIDNGGDVSSMSIVGGKIFLKAPPRIIEGVRWIVGQLSAPAQAQSGTAPGALGADEYVRVFKLKNTSAATILAAVEPIYAAVAERTDPEAKRLRFTADAANPVIVVRGPKRLVEEACEIMSQMDEARDALSVPAGVESAPEQAVGALDSRLIPLKNTPAMEMAEVLRAAGTVSERLRNGPRERAIAVDAGSNGLWVRSTQSQVDAIEEIVGALDTDGPIDDRAIEESKTIKLERARAAEVRHVLGLVLNANQRMKQCAVPRSFEVDASENTLTVSATPGQVDAIARMVESLDR